MMCVPIWRSDSIFHAVTASSSGATPQVRLSRPDRATYRPARPPSAVSRRAFLISLLWHQRWRGRRPAADLADIYRALLPHARLVGEAEDQVREVLLRAWRSRYSFQGAPASVPGCAGSQPAIARTRCGTNSASRCLPLHRDWVRRRSLSVHDVGGAPFGPRCRLRSRPPDSCIRPARLVVRSSLSPCGGQSNRMCFRLVQVRRRLPRRVLSLFGISTSPAEAAICSATCGTVIRSVLSWVANS